MFLKNILNIYKSNEFKKKNYFNLINLGINFEIISFRDNNSNKILLFSFPLQAQILLLNHLLLILFIK